MRNFFVLVCAVAVYLFSFSVSATAQEGAKALFFGETEQETVSVIKTDSGTAVFGGTEVKTETVQTPGKNRSAENKKNTTVAKIKKTPSSGKIATGLSYWIEVINPDGKVERTTAERRLFKTGERIRFAFKSNNDGYLYLLAIGSTGKGSVLFPDPRINEGKNFVTANTEYKVPFGTKSFVMDATPGEEKILVFFSKSEMENIGGYFAPKGRVEAQDTRVIYAYAENKGSKDILFEEDAKDTGFEPASYIVNKSEDPKGIIFKEIIVKHK